MRNDDSRVSFIFLFLDSSVFSEAKKTESERKKRTSDLGTSDIDFSIPDFPTLDFNSDLDISHSVINIPFSAPEFNFSSQEIASKFKNW